jgi:hypothetical protein
MILLGPKPEKQASNIKYKWAVGNSDVTKSMMGSHYLAIQKYFDTY